MLGATSWAVLLAAFRAVLATAAVVTEESGGAGIVMSQGIKLCEHEVSYVLLMDPAEDDCIIHPGKPCTAVSDDPLHVQLDGWPHISEVERHPLVLKQVKGGGDGDSLHILWVDSDLMIPLLAGENCVFGRLSLQRSRLPSLGPSISPHP